MKTVKTLFSTLVALIVLVLFCGCSDPSVSERSEPVNIAFVCGIADKESMFDSTIREMSMLPSQVGSIYTFVSVDETPSCITSGEIKDLSDRGYTDRMLERVEEGIRADLQSKLANFTPDSAQIDVAAATTYAVRSLQAASSPDKPSILVLYTSGKSTSGIINMVDTPLYKLDTEAAVPIIAQKMALDMSFIDKIVWYSAGDVCGQDSFSSEERVKLQEFYNALFQAMGAPEVTFMQDQPLEEIYRFPQAPVSIVEVADLTWTAPELVIANDEVFEEESSLMDTAVVFPEDQVRFLPDEDTFADPDASMAAIRPAVEFLLKHPEIRVLLYGTCAGDTDSDFSLELAESRAQRVKEEIVSCGVDENRIVVIRLRIQDDVYYQYGMGTGEAGAVNRKTVMLNLDSTLGQSLLSKRID